MRPRRALLALAVFAGAATAVMSDAERTVANPPPRSLSAGAPATGRIAGLATDGQGRPLVALPAQRASRPWVVRLTSDGSVDTSFAAGGVLRPPVEGSRVRIAVQRNGDVLVGGMRGHATLLRRFRPNGSLDRSFGTGGRLVLRRLSLEQVLVQPRGGIVVLATLTCPPSSCGYLYRNLQVLRYTASGRLVRHLNISHEAWEFDAVAEGPNGGFVVAGRDWELGYLSFDAFLPSGRVQRGFHVGALKGSTEETEDVPVDDIAIQNDGKLVIATPVGLWRRDRDGSVDSGFGAGGRVACDPSPASELFHLTPFSLVAATAGGKLVAAGGEGGCGLVRYLENGAVDPGFATDGSADLSASGISSPEELASLPDGSTLVGTWAGGSLRLARYTQAGQLDQGFGAGGVATWGPASPG